MTLFKSVAPALAGALVNRGYKALTPVQQAVLEPGAESADLLVSAQTGSGKTVAFGLAIEPTLLVGAAEFDKVKEPLALIVAPTRELALQVHRELDWLYANTGAKLVSCVGGMDMRSERRALAAGAHVVVGTPGRLRDHIERGALDLSRLRATVIDEADEMLDLGFRDDLEFILDAAPVERRTLMFSATVPRPIATLAKRFQRDAIRISTTADDEQHRDIDYRALQVAPNDRENAIINQLRYIEAKSTLVFCATRDAVRHLSSRLGNRGFAVVALSGELDQAQRNHALQAMRDGRARVCVATDVAARGIDLPNLDLVIHADLPNNRETLLHRSGRTGRAGRKGLCALIVPHTKRRAVSRLLNLAKIDAQWTSPPNADEIADRDRDRALRDPILQETVSESESQFTAELLSRYAPEQIAAAYLRQHLAGKPAPEELLDTAPPTERPGKTRANFEGGVWYRLSAGRKQNAEPRWLLPLICRAGHITRREVGAIRIDATESHFEISPQAAEHFQAAIERGGSGEKSISITRLESIPDDAAGTEKHTRSSRRKPTKSVDGKAFRKKRKTAQSRPTRRKNKDT